MIDFSLENLKKTKNIKKYRKGRGISQGRGKTCGRGQKGQNSRSSGGTRPGFEGGQTPLYRRIPKRGFKNINRVNNIVFNLNFLSKHFKSGETVNFESLLKKGIVRKRDKGKIKILGNGEITKDIKIKIDLMSKNASKKIGNN